VKNLPFDYNNGVFSTVKTAPGCSPEQVSLTYFGADERGYMSILLSWATCDAVVETPAALGDCTGSSKKGTVTGPLSVNGVSSVVYYGPSTAGRFPYNSHSSFWHAGWPKKLAIGRPTSYVYDYSKTGGLKYASPIIHHVLISGLQPGVKYDYVIVDNVQSADTASATSFHNFRDNTRHQGQWGQNPYIGSFKAPGKYTGRPFKALSDAATTAAAIATPAHIYWPPPPPIGGKRRSAFPFKVAVIGDPGQTYNTTDTLSHVLASDSDMLFLLADFTYADRPDLPTTLPTGCNITSFSATSLTYQPRWDTWARVFQSVLAKIPFLHANGNHEVETLPFWALPYNSNFTYRDLAYNSRYIVPHQGPKVLPLVGPVLPQPNAPVDANSPGVPSPNAYKNLYYKAEIPGVATTIWLTSYSPYDVNGFSQSSEQYQWLKTTLAAVDRRRTPWLVVNWHAPVYNTYSSHFKENECFRQAYEPLLLQHSVDILFFGHVHAYERTKPVRDYQVDNGGCAPVHITIGDAGNIEGVAATFVSANSSAYCSNATSYSFPRYQPQRCIKFNEGPGSGCADNTNPCFCFANQPAWSAYREPSFGHGELVFKSATEAVWKWYRNVDSQAEESDSVTITRDPTCPT
jgi:hypothetical protein